MGDFKKLKEVIDIIVKYKLMEEGYCSAEHDVLYLPLPKDLSKEDKDKLEKMGVCEDDTESLVFCT